jgi:hypothetical protein
MLEGVVGELLLEVAFESLRRLSGRGWVSLGFVALGAAAFSKAADSTGDATAILLVLTGAGLVLSPVALFLWLEKPKRPPPRRRRRR